MKILAIDTSSDTCSVAILENEKLIKEIKITDEKTHSQKLMPIIDTILKNCNYAIKDFDLFACSTGPGSFTGIRIGISTIKAFSDAMNKPAIGISSLKGLAYNVNLPIENSYVVSIIDAKHGNIYWGIFKKENRIYKKILNYSFDSIYNFLEKLKQLNKQFIFVGNGGMLYKDVIESTLEKNYIFIDNKNITNSNASSIGIAAFHKFSNGIIPPIIPLYLKKSSAELLLEDKKT